jgi:hypothetical protein
MSNEYTKRKMIFCPNLFFVKDRLDNMSIEDQAHADVLPFANGSFEIYIRPYIPTRKLHGDEILDRYRETNNDEL